MVWFIFWEIGRRLAGDSGAVKCTHGQSVVCSPPPLGVSVHESGFQGIQETSFGGCEVKFGTRGQVNMRNKIPRARETKMEKEVF